MHSQCEQHAAIRGAKELNCRSGLTGLYHHVPFSGWPERGCMSGDESGEGMGYCSRPAFQWRWLADSFK